jgi:TonB family protein
MNFDGRKWCVRAKSGCASLALARGPDPVPSPANVANPATEAEEKASGTPRPSPVPLEEAVSVTGTKASAGDGSRDLFSEETTTVLVFMGGAVIRLAAPVSVGQLVFLTLKKTNQEVVCQVLSKRDAQPGTDYVELQFTEERGDYWGVAFPKSGPAETEFDPPQRARVNEKPLEKHVPPAVLHHSDDGEQLQVEVEALREQLLGREKKKTEATLETTRDGEPQATDARRMKDELARVNDSTRVRLVEEKTELLMPPAKEKTEVARAVIGMALPTQKRAEKKEEAEEPDPSEYLLPQPELDFSQAPQSDGAVKAFRGPVIGKKARTVGIGAALVMALSVGAWYGNWRQYLPIGKKAPATVATARPVTARNVAPVSGAPVTNAGEAGTSTTVASSAAATKDSATNQTNAADPTAGETVQTKTESSTEGEASAKPSVGKEKPADEKDAVDADIQPAAAENAVSDAPVLPAKLLKAANPVYPPDAMTNYITGDVKAEVKVDDSGHVGEVKVISGPQALRDAAVAALKQYAYAPATQGGKAVGSTAVEVVKFWFNP